MTLKIGVSGVRGYVPDSLTPEIILDFAKAFGTYLGGGKVLVGSDPRSSSEFIKGIIFSGLLSTGCEVVDLGICPTPTVGINIPELKAVGGIVITASHNPLPWNGLKFMREDGIFLNDPQMKKLITIYEKKEFRKELPKKVTSDHTAIDTHLKKVLKEVNGTAIRHRKFRVALDCCNGAGSVACVMLLQKLGCEVEALNCNPSLSFPHPPEPIPENLADLCKTVKSCKADIGFALDADADRLAIVSEEGQTIGEELTLALAEKHILLENALINAERKVIVINLSTSKTIEDIAKENGAIVIRTKIGEVHVSEELKNLNGLIGGEGNGGVIYPAIGYNRDALTGIALILDYMAHTHKSISKLVAELPGYYMTKKKLECDTQEQAGQALEKVKNKFNKEDLILTDGIKVVFPHLWLHVRASNTEPIIRIIAEGKEKKEVDTLVSQVLKSLA